MSGSPASHPHESYAFFGGPIGDRFVTLARLMSERGHYQTNGDLSVDARMLQEIAYAHEAAQSQMSFMTPQRWAIEKLISIKETSRGQTQVMRSPRVDMDIDFTSRGNLCVRWRPRRVDGDTSRFGDFRISEYETGRVAFERPFFETFYLAGLNNYARAIKNCEPARQRVMTEIVRLAIDCARDIVAIASRTCDVRLNGRLQEILSPDTGFIDGFRYSDLASIEREKQEDEARRLNEHLTDLNRSLDEFEEASGMSAKWFCGFVEKRREDDSTYEEIAKELNAFNGPVAFTWRTALSTFRELSGKLDATAPEWRTDAAVTPVAIPKSQAIFEIPVPQAALAKTTSSANFMESVERRVRAHRHRETEVAPTTPSPPDYSRLRRYKNDPAILDQLGLETIDDLVTAINERRVGEGKRPISHGDFPTNKHNFEKLVVELENQSAPKPR